MSISYPLQLALQCVKPHTFHTHVRNIKEISNTTRTYASNFGFSFHFIKQSWFWSQTNYYRLLTIKKNKNINSIS